MGYLLYSSKEALKANIIFYIIYLKEVIENNILLAYLECLVNNQKYRKENSFLDKCCKETKKEIPKLPCVAKEHVFDFKLDADDSCFLENGEKSRKHIKRNIFPMKVL